MQKKPAPAEKPAPKKPATPPIEIKTQPKKKQPALERGPIERRTVDTRSAQVDVGKYDEKFDVMAQKNSNMRGGDTAVRKQKINQKSQQYRKPHRRRETESERLKRIEAERKKSR